MKYSFLLFIFLAACSNPVEPNFEVKEQPLHAESQLRKGACFTEPHHVQVDSTLSVYMVKEAECLTLTME